MGTFSSDLPFHGCGLRELLRQSGAPRPSRANLYRCNLRDDSAEWKNNMYWCLAALDEEQPVVPAPLSRGGAFCAKAAVVGQSTDGLGESGVSGRFTSVAVPTADMFRAGHAGTNAKTGDSGNTVADAAAWLGEPAACTASSGSRSACLSSLQLDAKKPPGQGRVWQAPEAPRIANPGGVRLSEALQPRRFRKDAGCLTISQLSTHGQHPLPSRQAHPAQAPLTAPSTTAATAGTTTPSSGPRGQARCRWRETSRLRLVRSPHSHRA